MAGPVGPPAMNNCKLRQARKGATVAVNSCAGVWLAGNVTSSQNLSFDKFISPSVYLCFLSHVLQCALMRAVQSPGILVSIVFSVSNTGIEAFQ